MPLYELAFVDSIASSPTTRLNLNDMTTWTVLAGTKFNPPQIQRAVVSTLLNDGGQYPASVYEDRVLTLVLQLTATAADTAADHLQDLARELDRDTNFLRWEPLTTKAVFFRTFRSDFTSITFDEGNKQVTVEVLAEPFAYGLKETVATATVSNNPASANGTFFDIASPRGDVETPLILRTSTTGLVSSNDIQTMIAVRRRGTPSATPYLLQAEAMTLGTNTTLPGNDGAMSGSGSNYARTTFGTASMTTRLSFFNPGSASVDNRGTYRVLVRTRKTVSGDDIQVRLRWGGSSGIITNDTVSLPSGTTIQYADLGLMSMPPGPDPVTDGLSGIPLSVYGAWIDLQAERVSGSGNLDWDYVLLVPADDRLSIIRWGITSGTNFLVVDATRDMVYATITSGPLHGVNIPQFGGGLPMVSPGTTNRIYFIRQVRPGAPTDTIGGTNDIDASYYPRYIHVSPVST